MTCMSVNRESQMYHSSLLTLVEAGTNRCHSKVNYPYTQGLLGFIGCYILCCFLGANQDKCKYCSSYWLNVCSDVTNCIQHAEWRVFSIVFTSSSIGQIKRNSNTAFFISWMFAVDVYTCHLELLLGGELREMQIL